MLYDFFVVKFEQAKEKFGVDRMASRLRDFFDLNRAVREDCVMMQADNRQGWINLMADQAQCSCKECMFRTQSYKAPNYIDKISPRSFKACKDMKIQKGLMKDYIQKTNLLVFFYFTTTKSAQVLNPALTTGT